MAQRFVEQAQQQLSPIFQEQQQSLQQQIPAMQKLFESLSQGLAQRTDRQMETGTQNILEDASRRGVLRSTLPVDSQQGLQEQLGQALVEGQAQLGLQEAQQVGGIQQAIAQLAQQEGQSVTQLAGQLQQADLREREFEMRQQEMERQAQLARQQASQGQSLSPDQIKQVAFSSAAEHFRPGRDGYVSPTNWRNIRRDWVRAGGDPAEFDRQFRTFLNPAHFRRDDLENYQVIKEVRDEFKT